MYLVIQLYPSTLSTWHLNYGCVKQIDHICIAYVIFLCICARLVFKIFSISPKLVGLILCQISHMAFLEQSLFQFLFFYIVFKQDPFLETFKNITFQEGTRSNF